jgi:hypothetical protein
MAGRMTSYDIAVLNLKALGKPTDSTHILAEMRRIEQANDRAWRDAGLRRGCLANLR